MVLDGEDFDYEDGLAFFMAKGIVPQNIKADASTTKSLKSVSESMPTVTASSNLATMGVTAIFGGDMSSMGDMMADEQQSGTSSAYKSIQQGSCNS